MQQPIFSTDTGFRIRRQQASFIKLFAVRKDGNRRLLATIRRLQRLSGFMVVDILVAAFAKYLTVFPNLIVENDIGYSANIKRSHFKVRNIHKLVDNLVSNKVYQQ